MLLARVRRALATVAICVDIGTRHTLNDFFAMLIFHAADAAAGHHRLYTAAGARRCFRRH